MDAILAHLGLSGPMLAQFPPLKPHFGTNFRRFFDKITPVLFLYVIDLGPILTYFLDAFRSNFEDKGRGEVSGVYPYFLEIFGSCSYGETLTSQQT